MPPTLSETCSPTLWLWAGRVLYLGPSLDLDRHSGAVSCVAVGLDEPFTVEVTGTVTARSALIPARVRHRLRSPGGRMMFCYLDPGSPSERACRAAMSQDTEPATRHRDEDELIALGRRLSATPDADLADRWLDLAAPRPASVVGHPGIRGAAEAVMNDPARNWRAGELAALAGWSTSAFLRGFRAETGTSFRRYRLWARMLRACQVLAGGGNLTLAAAEAGFATPSHLSSTFHTVFGLTPSRLLDTGVAIHDRTRP
ncbi:AraC family transcriptional regulator [Pseudonocardia spinosispora]|uniref:AraC family transcriptional regulator n=1 Tax=Pseudonocardia spinosispora TaxID=103441 RepID=UPI000416D7B7|nr:AraC family transcriptional regulator [Pseudonocardia spinosispora]